FGVFNQGISVFGGPCPFTAPATGNVIGGSAADGNSALNSSLNGIAADSEGNTVSYNAVRGTKNGAALHVAGNQTTIGPANTVTANNKAGVVVLRQQDAITQNSIDANGVLGIDLSNDGVTPSDAGDPDTGPNDLQNFPTLTTATTDTET